MCRHVYNPQTPQLKSVRQSNTVPTHVHVHVPPSSHPSIHIHTIPCFVMVVTFPSCLYWMFVSIAAVGFYLGSNIPKLLSCLYVWESICVWTLTYTVTLLSRIKSEKCTSKAQARFHTHFILHACWSLLIRLSTKLLDFVTEASHYSAFFTPELFALWPPTLASIVVWILLTQVLWEVKDWFLKIPGPQRFCCVTWNSHCNRQVTLTPFSLHTWGCVFTYT